MKTLFLLALIHVLCAGDSNINVVNNTGQKSGISATHHSPVADTVTLNGQWYLQPMLPSDTATGKTPVLSIELNKNIFSGNTGCNTMRGSLKKTDSSLVFNENIVTSRMFCSGYDEAAFLRSLLRTNRYRLDNGQLVLMQDATELSRWARKPAQLQIKKA